MTHQKMWNSAKAVPEGEFLTLKEESLKINLLSFHPKKLEKEKQMKGGKKRNTDKSKIIEIDVAIKQK